MTNYYYFHSNLYIKGKLLLKILLSSRYDNEYVSIFGNPPKTNGLKKRVTSNEDTLRS